MPPTRGAGPRPPSHPRLRPLLSLLPDLALSLPPLLLLLLRSLLLPLIASLLSLNSPHSLLSTLLLDLGKGEEA